MNKGTNVSIVKADGTRAVFDRSKLMRALQNSGASIKQSMDIALRVEEQIYDGMPSKKIYQIAYALLKKSSHRSAGRYRLKKAILDMGPSGYPFEIFIGRLFESWGYRVEVGKQMPGKCITHEVDVVADKPGEKIIVECKFHSDYRAKTNVHVPLYIHSRFNDIRDEWLEKHLEEEIQIKGFVVTSTRFTTDAIRFSECAGLGILSWDYPEKASLKYYIDQSGFHPITSLHTLNKFQKKFLLDEGIVLCKELLNDETLLNQMAIKESQREKVLNEARALTTKVQK